MAANIMATMMTEKGKKGQPARVTKQDWIEAAVLNMAQTGKIDVNIEGLARSLSISKGSFYHYFHSREELIHSALQYYVEREKALVKAHFSNLDTGHDPTQVAEALIANGVATEGHNVIFALAALGKDSDYYKYLNDLTQQRLDVGVNMSKAHNLPHPEMNAVHSYAMFLGITFLGLLDLAPEFQAALNEKSMDQLLVELFYSKTK